MASFGSGESARVVAVNGSIGLPRSRGDLGTVSCAQQRNGHWQLVRAMPPTAADPQQNGRPGLARLALSTYTAYVSIAARQSVIWRSCCNMEVMLQYGGHNDGAAPIFTVNGASTEAQRTSPPLSAAPASYALFPGPGHWVTPCEVLVIMLLVLTFDSGQCSALQALRCHSRVTQSKVTFDINSATLRQVRL